MPHVIFAMHPDGIPANRLVMRVQPDEGIKLWMMVKEPGPGDMRLQHVPLDMSFAEAFGVPPPTPMSACSWMRYAATPLCSCGATKSKRHGNLSIPFATPGRSRANRRVRMPPGTWGPNASVALIERDGRTWNEEYE